MEPTLFDELRRYLLWTPADDAALTRLHEAAQPHLARIADAFYDRILGHPEAAAVLRRGESSLGRLKQTLRGWMDSLLRGPRDEDYVRARMAVGRVHVRIGLGQHFMLGAMNLVREELEDVVDALPVPEPDRRALRRSLGRALDLDLALMLESWREALLEERAKAERMSALGQVAGFLAHELRNPLSVIDAGLYLLKSRTKGDEKAQSLVARLGHQTALADEVIQSVLGLARDAPLRRARLKPGALAEQAAGSVQRPDETRLELHGLAELPEIDGDPGQLRLAFVNLVKNAVQAVAPAGCVRVDGRVEDGAAVVGVQDDGPGVAPAFRHRLFEALATTRAHGTGLGLALVRRIVERHGGRVSYEPAPGRGARFEVRLPVAPPAEAP